MFGLKRLAGMLRKNQKGLSPVDDRGWFVIQESSIGAYQRDERVSVETQLAFFAVYACVTLIASDLGKLRPRLMEKSHGIWQETFSASFSPVLRKPNRFQNYIQFKESWAISKLTRGNAYGLKVTDGRGIVTAIYILDPCRVTPLVADDGSVFYRLDQDNLSGLEESQVIVPDSAIIHDRMNCLFHPLVGIAPLYASSIAAQQGIAIQKQGRNFFINGARPSGVLTAPGEISQETADRIKAVWETKYSGDNAGKVAVLGDGLEYKQMVMNSNDAQMVEQLKLTADQVCSAFRVPSFKVGVGTMPTFQNGEILNQIYYDNCLQSFIEQFELCLDGGLGIGDGVRASGRELGVELDVDGLLRMDQATLLKTLGDGIKGGVLKPNEARQRVDLPAVPGGDQVYLQQQNYSLAALAKRDAKDNPFGSAPPAPPNPPTGEDQTDKALATLWKRAPETLAHA